jgi:hypothetical protein
VIDLFPTAIAYVRHAFGGEVLSINIHCISDSAESYYLTTFNFYFYDHLMDKEIQTKRCVAACLQRIGAMGFYTHAPRRLVLICLFSFDNRCSTEVRMELYSRDEFPSAQNLIYTQLGGSEGLEKLADTQQAEFDTLFVAYIPRGITTEPALSVRAVVAADVEYSDTDSDSEWGD